MPYTDAVTRIGQIQAQFAALQTAFSPASHDRGDEQGYVLDTEHGHFHDRRQQLRQCARSGRRHDRDDRPASLSAKAQSMLTTDQQQFATRLAADTGLSTQVISAWMLAEESGGAAQTRQSAHNNDWLNIGYTDSGTYGSSDSIWSNPATAADATAGWLKGQDTIPGYGRAAPGVQAIMKTAGQSPQAQMTAIQNSGWASGGYPELAQLFSQVA